MFVYFPSCNFTRTFPNTSSAAKEFMQKQGVRVEGCCRPGHKNLTAGEQALVVCQTCTMLIGERRPDIPMQSAWEYLDGLEFAWPDYHGEEITIQDCWRARHKPALLDAVRLCMEKMNLRPVELAENRENTQFDGVWRFQPVAKKNLEIAPNYFGEVAATGLELLSPEEQKARMEAWVSQYTTSRVAVYCTACLKGAELGGAHAVHLLELLTANL